MNLLFTACTNRLISRIVWLLLSYGGVFYEPCLAQSPVFQHLDVRSGLAQNTVLTITQDAKGFMWFGTPEGLNRYDSRTFRVYRNDPANPRSLSSNYITSSFYDSRGILWLGTPNGLNKYNSETDSFDRFSHNPAVKSSLTHNHIYSIYEDSKGTLWIGTAHGLNRLIDPSTNRFEHYFFPGPATQNTINNIRGDKKGTLWLATNHGLVRMRSDQNNVRYKVFTHIKNTPNSISDNLITAIDIDSNNNLWVGTESGELDRYDPSTNSFAHLRKATSDELSQAHNIINCMSADNVGNLWIGTTEGVTQLETSSMKFTNYQNDPDNPQSLSDNSIYSIFRDSQGSVWAGTYYAGVNVLYPNNTPFKVLKANRTAKGLSNKIVSCIAEDRKHNLWIGADGEGLNYINSQTGLIAHYIAGPDPLKNLPSKLIKAVYIDKKGDTWVGMRWGGLSKIDPSRRQLTTYHYSSNKKADNVYALLEDSQQRFWALTSNRLTLFDKKKGIFNLYKSAIKTYSQPDSSVTTYASIVLIEDSHKNIWIGGREGMYLLKYKSKQVNWLPFEKNTRNANSPGHGTVYAIHEDIYGNIWIGTSYDGLKRFDPEHSTFVNYLEADGLLQNTINAIQSDDKGILWISTLYGLTRFDPKTKTSHYYTNSDGIPGSEFEVNASYRGYDGQLYFGSNDGLVHFYPTAIKINKRVPNVMFTGLEVANKPVKVGDETNLLVNDIGLTEQLTFNYQQNFFTISFASLNYIKSEKNQYAYKLEGIDQEWRTIKTPSITYNNLPSGEYNLLVKGTNNDGVWSSKPAQMRLIILPPIWRTWWAYSLYFLAFSVMLYFILRFFWLRNTFNREQELHQVKLDFFTNISHEIRTHLTLIIGPIDVLLRTKKDDKDVQKQLYYAKNSSDSLLDLVTELMDFQKAESNQINLHVVQNDIIPYIKNILVSFEHLSEKRDINLSFSSNKESIELWYDPAQLTKVIYNLLSNAYKFISDNGEIRINIQEKVDFVEIKLSDNGKGISEENVKKLFTNYFQVYDYGVKNTGYGIGLALSRTITELHKGTLSVESKEAQNGTNGFTCFTIKLRKGHSHFSKEQLITTDLPIAIPAFRENTPGKLPESVAEKDKPYTILLVEDNDELRTFIRDILSHQYYIIEATNGKDAWQVATAQIPDMVISDIMMADMNGLELCHRLKDDERTSHIPVIILTAKSSSNYLIEGYEAGADSYITKPVSVQVLELNIRNLFNARELIRQKYSRHITLEPQNIVINTVDEEFINKIIKITEKYMIEPGFGVDMLTTELGMSAPVLYKKLKALTNMSVNDFTKSIRMKRAAQLLQQKHLNVNEVASMIGFDDRRYFSREFKKIFGQKPSEYAKGGTSIN